VVAWRVDVTRLLGRLWPWGFVLVLASCGPPLTEPSSKNLSGHWTSTDHIGPVFNVEVTINQTPDGTIVGTWSSDVSPPNPTCPPELTNKGTGPVSGRNTVLGVQFSLLGAGDFQGQSDSRTTMRGSVLSCGVFFPIHFALAGPAPAG